MMHPRSERMGAKGRPLHLACAANEEYAPLCAVMLRSVIRHTPYARVAVHYLCAPDFAVDLRAKLHALADDHGATVSFHEVDDQTIEGLPPLRGMRRYVWYRAILPSLVPNVDRILYLDADTFVVDSLEELWRIELGDHPFAAVPNAIDPDVREAQLAALGLPSTATYFNSGVMLMSMDAFRAERMTERVLEYARSRDDLKWGDQDALNAVLATNYLKLHPRWNCQNSLFSWPAARRFFGDPLVDEAIASPAILHFGGDDPAGKPWHELSRHPYTSAYRSDFYATGLALPPSGRSPQGGRGPRMLRRWVGKRSRRQSDA